MTIDLKARLGALRQGLQQIVIEEAQAEAMLAEVRQKRLRQEGAILALEALVQEQEAQAAKDAETKRRLESEIAATNGRIATLEEEIARRTEEG